MRATQQHGIRNICIGATPVPALVIDTFPTAPIAHR